MTLFIEKSEKLYEPVPGINSGQTKKQTNRQMDGTYYIGPSLCGSKNAFSPLMPDGNKKVTHS